MPKSKGRESHQRGTVYSCPPEDLFIVGLDGTEEERKGAINHPLYDPRINNEIDQRLVSSMLECGWFGAIEVSREGARDLVVAGRSRVRAARSANDAIRIFNETKEGKASPKTPIRVEYKIQRREPVALMGVMISENELRTEDTIPNKARKAARYMSEGKSSDQTAAIFGTSKQTIKNWLGLLEEKNKDLLSLIERGKINPTAAYAIMKLTGEEREQALQEALAGDSGAAVRDRIVRRKASRDSDPDDEGESDEERSGSSKGKRSTSETPHEAPGKRLLKKLYEQDGSDLDPLVRNTIGWVLGLTGANKIRGLVQACREVHEIPSEDE